MERFKEIIEKIKNIDFKRIPKVIFVSLVGFIFALYYVASSAKSTSEITPVRDPASKPYVKTLAGLGIIESLDQNIVVAPSYSGKIAKVFVREGARVKQGDPLYALDVEDLRASLDSLEADATALQLNYENNKLQWDRVNNVSDPRAISRDEFSQKQYAMKQSDANYKSLRAKIKQNKIQINRSVIKAPRDGEVLKVNIRAGEYVATNSTGFSPLILGSSNKLQIRIDIDEINASNYHPGVKAIASLKGDSSKKFPIKFVRVQPYMVPKTNLSGMSTERVDVRVLQVIYDFAPPKFPVYVGQQVDVFFDN
ncbi:MAG: efflux RND transporter periplasmic adaptor subunit [bacterium]